MKKIIKVLVLSLISFLAFTNGAWAGDIALHAGHVVNPETGTVEDNKYIIISGNKISAIVDELGNADIDEVIDLKDKWVMPGLMDMHTHITWEHPQNLPSSRIDYAYHPMQNSTGYRAILGAKNAKIMLMAGFTTLRDVGNNANYADSDIARAQREGLIIGSRIINSGKIISVMGGQSHNFSPEVGRVWNQEYVDADTPDEMVKAIRSNVYYGAKLIKIVMGDQAYSYTEADVKVAVDAARNAGMTLAAHAYGDKQVTRAVNGGAKTIEHGMGISDETLKLMKSKGVYLVGTDFPEEHLSAIFGPERGKRDAIASIDRLGRAFKIGVPLAFGTDTISNLPGKNRAEMAFDYLTLWQKAGVTPEGILKAMTINSAKAMEMEKSLGSIAVGKIADIIATDENPLKNIYTLKDVTFVMQSGKIIK